MGISRAKLCLFIILAAIIIYLPVVSSVSAAEQDSAKVQALRQTGKQLLDVGSEQYRRGKYDTARVTVNKAAVYKEYLIASDAAKLDELLGKLNSQSPKTVVVSPVAETTPVTQSSVQSAQPVQPVQQTPGVVVSEPIQISTQTGQNDVNVNGDSINVNNQGIEFVPVDSCDVQQPSSNLPPAVSVQTDVNGQFIMPAPTPTPESDVEGAVDENTVSQPQPLTPETPASEMEDAKENYIEVIKQKQRIQQSYTKSIVNEAVARAKEYAGKEEFAKAKDEISNATSVVERNKLLLGETDYSQYTATLSQLLQEVNTRQTEVEAEKAQKAKDEAQASQEKLRTQQAADRQKRIQDLLTHAAEYQEQQRYQEALAQVETLLVIDPTNREALRTQATLEDIINLRRQLEIKKEMGKEEEKLFVDNQESMIPHAGLMTYPKNWQDIAAKRKPKTITGLSAADAAVYKLLETPVDLSSLTPDTPFSDAIELIKNSVEPPLKIVVRWKDLEENAYIERDTVISMQGLSGIPVGKGLKELLDSVSGGVTKIDYVVDDGIITVATKESLPNKLVTHAYDITELIGTPANYSADLSTQEDARTSQSTNTTSADQLEQERTDNAGTIIQMIQETVAPNTWLINGGEGTISSHGNRLVISQTPQVHEQIQELLTVGLRESLGQQVSIETRFLFVTENFLEDIGLDMTINLPHGIGSFGKGGIVFQQNSYEFAAPNAGETGVPGSLAGGSAAIASTGFDYGSVLDDLSLSFFLRATQAHRDAKMLTAPRVTVLSGESAAMRVSKETAYVSDYDFQDITSSGDSQPVRVIADPTTDTVTGGVVLNVTPTISADKKYVILAISTNYTKTNLTTFDVFSPTSGDSFPISLPTLDVAEVQTRVSVPDRGTLLIGGQKLGAEINKEAGVPGLSKTPIIGRLFSNRSKVKDQDILLVLVKPTIILQDEAEREYFAPLE